MGSNIDWTEELLKLKKLMEEGKISFDKDFAPELKKVMFDKITGTTKEETISPRLKEVILELRGKGE
jgi:hypothetical protein